MLILSLDTSLTKTGYAVLRVYPGEKPRAGVDIVEYGLIKTSSKDTDGVRLRDIVKGIFAIIERYPGLYGVIPREEGIVRYNLPTKQIFKAHGVTEFVLGSYIIEDINIQTVKAWARKLTGSPGKRNDKDMVAEAVRLFFNDPQLRLNKEGDEADAIAVGISYLLREGLIA
jgi:crossover junction endodeoxyribonuclease RuvC